jgi:hypothetical protein
MKKGFFLNRINRQSDHFPIGIGLEFAVIIRSYAAGASVRFPDDAVVRAEQAPHFPLS